jgi:hypothetical protein
MLRRDTGPRAGEIEAGVCVHQITISYLIAYHCPQQTLHLAVSLRPRINLVNPTFICFALPHNQPRMAGCTACRRTSLTKIVTVSFPPLIYRIHQGRCPRRVRHRGIRNRGGKQDRRTGCQNDTGRNLQTLPSDISLIKQPGVLRICRSFVKAVPSLHPYLVALKRLKVGVRARLGLMLATY